jgi:hypothetical protein
LARLRQGRRLDLANRVTPPNRRPRCNVRARRWDSPLAGPVAAAPIPRLTRCRTTWRGLAQPIPSLVTLTAPRGGRSCNTAKGDGDTVCAPNVEPHVIHSQTAGSSTAATTADNTSGHQRYTGDRRSPRRKRLVGTGPPGTSNAVTPHPVARKPAVFSSRQTSDCGPAPLAGCRHINHGRARAEWLGRSWRSGAGTRRGHEGLAWPRLGEAGRTPA